MNYETSDTDNEIEVENQVENQVTSKSKDNKKKGSNEKFEALLTAQKILISKCKPSKV